MLLFLFKVICRFPSQVVCSHINFPPIRFSRYTKPKAKKVSKHLLLLIKINAVGAQ